jgi:ankyrin repeat protein
MTPLRLAVDLNDVPLARHLLEKGAKVQYREGTRGQFSPMHAAQSAEMVQLLLDHNADPELVDDINRRSLQWYVSRSMKLRCIISLPCNSWWSMEQSWSRRTLT